jgi:perosamine synthetase
MRVLEGPVLSLGPELTAFESELAACAGVSHAVATNSGTSALHVAMLALGIGPGDEVITTPFSFIASSNCILFVGAVPVFVDIDPLTLAIDPGRIEEKISSRTKAILAVDVFGHPANWDALAGIAARHSLKLVEDSAEAIGSTYRGRRAGGLGDIGVFAFYPNKQITTGEGGALLTNSAETAALARSFRNQGRGAGGGWLSHENLGYNFRISDINCALGRAQLSRLDEILASRSRVAERYNRLLADIPGVRTPHVSRDTGMSWFVYVVQLAAEFSRADRDAILQLLRDRGIGCSNYFPSIHLERVYRARFGYRAGAFPVAESVSDRTIALPFHGNLSADDAGAVADSLREAVATLRTKTPA